MKNLLATAACQGIALTFVLCTSARAADLLVDPSGAPGTYTTIQAAIQAAQPGDRILVLPGTYAAFSVTKSIHIVGLGASPASVVTSGIHLGLGFPNQNYHVSISRLRVDAGPSAPLAITGQELGVGKIEFESVQVDGGLRLLAGEAGCVLALANCTVVGDLGQGFDGATCHIAAPAPSSLSITRCRLQGARGDLFQAMPPLAGLLLDRGVTVQIAQCDIRGGRGGIAQAGAPGLHVRQGQVRAIGTTSIVRGGDGGAGAAGGPGVLATSTVFRGSATFLGGAGSPNGPASTGGGAVLPISGIAPELEVRVEQALYGPAIVGAGTNVRWHLDADGVAGVVLMGIAAGVPLPAPLDRLQIDPGAASFMPADVDFVLPSFGGFVGLPLFLQGVAIDDLHGAYPATAPYALRLDG